VVLFVFFGSINVHASDLIAMRSAGREPNIECRTSSGTEIPIIDQRQRDPITIIPGETPGQSIIAYDSWQFAEVPRYILHFEQARKCIEISSPQMLADTGESTTSSSGPTSSRSDPTQEEIEAKIDCLAINLMRDQGLISSQELQEIAKFYALHGGVGKEERDPSRGKHILDCFRYYKQYQRIAPPKGLILK
jgi:hypothetical protein